MTRSPEERVPYNRLTSLFEAAEAMARETGGGGGEGGGAGNTEGGDGAKAPAPREDAPDDYLE